MATINPGSPYQPGPKSVSPTNGLGIAGFVLSLIGILLTCGTLNVISLPLSLIALAWKPRGLAIAGAIISTVGVLFLALIGWGMVSAIIWGQGVAEGIGKEFQTQAAIADAKNAIENYRSQNNTLPDGIEGNKLVIEKKDGWGTELRYDLDGNTYLIRSAGADKKFDTEDDVTSKDSSAMEVETNLDIDSGDPSMPSDGPVLIPSDTPTIDPPADTVTPEKSDDSE